MREQFFHVQITHRERPVVQVFNAGTVYDTKDWPDGNLHTAKYRRWRDSFVPHLAELDKYPTERKFYRLLNAYIENRIEFMTTTSLGEIEDVGNDLVQEMTTAPNEEYRNNMQGRCSALTEMIYEIVRIQVAPKLSSRFKCIFLLKMESISKYVHRLLVPEAFSTVVYTIEPVDAKTTEHDAAWLDRHAANKYDVNEICETARSYWSGTRTDNPLMEVLCIGSFKVIASSHEASIS